ADHAVSNPEAFGTGSSVVYGNSAFVRLIKHNDKEHSTFVPFSSLWESNSNAKKLKEVTKAGTPSIQMPPILFSVSGHGWEHSAGEVYGMYPEGQVVKVSYDKAELDADPSSASHVV